MGTDLREITLDAYEGDSSVICPVVFWYVEDECVDTVEFGNSAGIGLWSMLIQAARLQHQTASSLKLWFNHKLSKGDDSQRQQTVRQQTSTQIYSGARRV